MSVLADSSIRIVDLTLSENEEWVLVNLLLEPLSLSGKAVIENWASDEEVRIEITDKEKYEHALKGLRIETHPDHKDDEENIPVNVLYDNGDPWSFTRRVKVMKEEIIYELDDKPGIYQYTQYCVNNRVVKSAIEELRELINEGKDSTPSPYVELSTLQRLVETLQLHWH